MKTRTRPPRTFTELALDLSSERLEQEIELRGLLLCIDLPYRAIATKTFVSKSALWAVANGKRKGAPDGELLGNLRKLALERAGSEEALTERLAAIRHELLAALPGRQEVEAGYSCPSCGSALLGEQVVTADTSTENTCAAPDSVVPVPLRQGDRHNRVAIDVAWAPAEVVWAPAVDLRQDIAGGNFERANAIIRHVGIGAPPSEAANSISVCRDLGLHDAAKMIGAYAGKRPDRDVLRVLQLLLQQRLYDDAAEILGHALRRPTSEAQT